MGLRFGAFPKSAEREEKVREESKAENGRKMSRGKDHASAKSKG